MVKERLENVLMALVDPPVVPQRDHIDPDKVRELAESIREQGLLEAVTLRPVNGRYEIIFGHRRYLAHRFLGKTDIKAIIRDMTDMEVTIVRAIENIQREDLSPIEEAKAYRLMMAQGGLTRTEVAKKVGKANSTIDKYTQLLKLPVSVQEAIDRKQIAMDVGFALGEIDDDAMLNYYVKMAVDNGVTTPVVRMWVDDYFKSKEGTLYDAGAGNPLETTVVEPTKNYTSCNLCQDPIEIREVVHLCVCHSCRDKLRSLRSAKS